MGAVTEKEGLWEVLDVDGRVLFGKMLYNCCGNGTGKRQKGREERKTMARKWPESS